jgi:hypothetical protein
MFNMVPETWKSGILEIECGFLAQESACHPELKVVVRKRRRVCVILPRDTHRP